MHSTTSTAAECEALALPLSVHEQQRDTAASFAACAEATAAASEQLVVEGSTMSKRMAIARDTLLSSALTLLQQMKLGEVGGSHFLCPPSSRRGPRARAPPPP